MLEDVLPRKLSFSSAQKLLDAFSPYLSSTQSKLHQQIELEMLKAIAKCQLKIQPPGRKEPRKVKKRKQKYSYLTITREQARKRLNA